MSGRQRTGGRSTARSGKRTSQGKADGRHTRSAKKARLEVSKESSGSSTPASVSSSSRATTKRKSRGAASADGRHTRSAKSARLQMSKESSASSGPASVSSSSRATTKRKSRDAVSGANGGSASGEAKQLFISVGHDKGEVDRFAEDLKKDLEGIGFTVWMDVDIPAGTPWVGGIGSGVHKCKGLIPIITNKYVNSEWCAGELTLAKTKKKSIFPVKYEEDVDFTKPPHAPGVEYIIRGLQWTFFRPEVDDYKKSLAKLVTGVTASEIYPGGEETTDFGGKTAPKNGANFETDDHGSSNEIDCEPDGRDLEMSVVKKVTDSQGLAEHLQLEKARIEMIMTEEKKSIDRNRRILYLWKDGLTREPITWRTLITALQEMGMKGLAAELEKKFEKKT